MTDLGHFLQLRKLIIQILDSINGVKGFYHDQLPHIVISKHIKIAKGHLHHKFY